MEGEVESRRTFTRKTLPFIFGCARAFAQEQNDFKEVLTDGKLKPGFDMGVDDNEHRRNWLSRDGDHMVLTYPAGLEWGAVFVTRGKPKAKDRPFIDLSDYKTLVIEMRGGLGGEKVEIGVKTNEQEDDGTETKFKANLTTDWEPYSFPISKFKDVSPAKLYVVAEFVFSDAKAQTILVRKIEYAKRDSS
jgi:hypothetical protein